MRVFAGNCADLVWLDAVRAVLDDRESLSQNSRAGCTRELLHCTLELRDPRQRWCHARMPPLNPAFAIAELIWILRGRNDSAFLNYWNSKLPRFAGEGPTYHGAYGHRMRQHLGVDQLFAAMSALHANPSSRQVVLQIWDARADLPGEDGNPRSPDIPCNLVSCLRIQQGKLHWMQVMRSNDLFRGTPYNLLQFTGLQEVVAGWLGLELGVFALVVSSLHAYENDITELSRRVPEDVFYLNTDSIAADWDDSIAHFSRLEGAVEQMITPGITEPGLIDLLKDDDLPQAYHHLMLVLASECARRRGWYSTMREAAGGIENPALSTSWRLWASRLGVEST